ncbi:DNA-binding protein [Candidatus Bipolaricaulota bacterium]|nr:DNA-binding protein [Candidatus Bipolaricaulota bacterium]
MKYKMIGDKLFVRLEEGEEIVSKLEQVLEDEGIHAGSFQGIGAVSKATLGHYSLKSKDYSEQELNQPLEIVSLQGTVSGEGVHPHACLGTKDMETYGGHLVEAVVAATCEVIVKPEPGSLDRYHDEEIGLDLLDI